MKQKRKKDKLESNPSRTKTKPLSEPSVLYEDKDLLVLHKPPYWVVTNALTTKDQQTIQNWLAKREYPLSSNTSLRQGIVHRIDKETSGILLVAKSKKALENVQKQFKQRLVEKSYIALVHGKLEIYGTVNAAIGRLPWNRQRFGILSGGRSAETVYKLIKEYKRENNTLSLIEITPKTGRTHQIRVHMKYIHRPIVSDEFYAGRKTARSDREWCPRLFLHASSIKFSHPTTTKSISFTDPLPSDLTSVLDKLAS